MDSSFSRIGLVTLLLLIGIGSSARAAVPPCAESADELWELRRQIAEWTANRGMTAVDGGIVQRLPDSCYLAESQPIAMRARFEALQNWSTQQSSLADSDGIAALWLIDEVICGQLASGMPVAEETRGEIIEAVEDRRSQFDAVRELQFPLSPTDSISLGDAIDDLAGLRLRIQAQWHAQDAVEQVQMKRQLLAFRRELESLHEDEEMEFLGPLIWDSVMSLEPLPAPVGEDNIKSYLRFVEIAATYESMLEQLEGHLDAAVPSNSLRGGTVDPKMLEALRQSVDPSKFREPLQIPPIAARDDMWLRNLLSNLFSRFQISRQVGEGIRWLGIFLCALLLGWIAHLLMSGTDPWGRRSFRFGKGDEQELVARGRHLSPAAQFKLALEAARAGRHLEAWHWLTQGFILGLAQSELVKLDWSRTNREVLRELHHKRVHFLEPATSFFRTAEGVVYGGRATSLDEIEQFERSLSSTLASLGKRSK